MYVYLTWGAVRTMHDFAPIILSLGAPYLKPGVPCKTMILLRIFGFIFA